ncbi:MAG TPA: hypothetical protein VNM48_03015 [Chloroflexota bacterium]|nr:hypothetical protein [Chloroflexota bacterium]
MSKTWGVETEQAPASKAKVLNPELARSGHSGIVWIHVAAIGIWLFTALLLGALWLAGKNVPGAIVIGGLLAAGGHGVFVAVHLSLAHRARVRASQALVAEGPEVISSSGSE